MNKFKSLFKKKLKKKPFLENNLIENKKEENVNLINQNKNYNYAYIDLFIDNVYQDRIIIKLYNDIVPKTVENFKSLAKMGIYNNTKIHRVIPNFIAQAGDFTRNNGKGGISIFEDEFKNENFKIKHDKKGIISMAKNENKLIGSQFFITLENLPFLDGEYTAFGEIIEGIHLVDKINKEPTKNEKPLRELKISNIGIFENIEELNKFKNLTSLFKTVDELQKNLENVNINNILKISDEIVDKENYVDSINSINWFNIPYLQYKKNLFIYKDVNNYYKKKIIEIDTENESNFKNFKLTNNNIIEIKDLIVFENNILVKNYII